MNKEPTEYSLLHKLIRSWVLIAAGVLLALFAAAESGHLQFGIDWIDKTWRLIVEVFLHVALIFVFFELWFERKTKESFLDYMGQKIAESFTLSEEVTKRLSVDFKKDAIKKLFLSIFLEKPEAADQVYAGIIGPYLRHDFCYRRNYEYDVHLYRGDMMVNEEGVADEALQEYNSHVFLKEEISFARSCFKKREATVLGIGIALDDMVLEKMFHSELLVFREFIDLEGDMQRKVASMIEAFSQQGDASELLGFVRNVLKLEMRVVGEERELSEPRIEVPMGMKGFHVLFPLKRVYREVGAISLRMTVPQKASSNTFRMSVAELTDGGRISFRNHIEGKSLSSVSYLTSSEGSVRLRKEHSDHHTYDFHGQWVYPNSGVVFVWQDK